MDPIFENALLISEITKRSAIWDITHSAFYDEELKRVSWREVVEVFSRPTDSIQTKKKLESILRLKWVQERRKFSSDVKRTVTICNGIKSPFEAYEELRESENGSPDPNKAKVENVSDREWIFRLRKMLLGESEMGVGYVRIGLANSLRNKKRDDERAQIMAWRNGSKQMIEIHQKKIQNVYQQAQQNFRRLPSYPAQRNVPPGFESYVVPQDHAKYVHPQSNYMTTQKPSQEHGNQFNRPPPGLPPTDPPPTGPRYQRDPLIGANCGIQYNMFNATTDSAYPNKY